MKFIKLEILNLASLDRPGGETINFQEGALGNSNIFSIVGPTGSGKSTLLDAICLALYNRAPRYPRMKRDRNQYIEIYGKPMDGERNRLAPTDSRNILTRGKNDGYSKLTFLANNGMVYRAEWSVHKKTKTYDDAVTTLYRLSVKEGKPVEEMMDWNELQQIIGLDYEQFLRTVLIAQGSFANFLSAKENERYELLEKLIGCEEMYTRIASLIKQKRDESLAAYNEISAAFSAQERDIIPDEELVALRDRITELEAVEKQAKEELGKVTESLAWYDADERYEGNIRKYEALFSTAKQRLESMQQQSVRLELHDNTLDAVNLYKEIKASETKIANQEVQLKQLANEIGRQEQEIKTEVEVTLEKLKQDAVRAAETLEQQRPLINQAREIKAQLEPFLLLQKEKERAYKTSRDLATKARRLVTDPGIDLTTAEARYAQESERLDKRNQQNRKELESDALNTDSLEKEVQSLRETRTLITSQNLQLLRQELTDGNPCPLCGATHHPYHDEAEYIQVTNNLDGMIGEKEQEISRRRRRVIELNNQLSTADPLYRLVEMLKLAMDAAKKVDAEKADCEAYENAKLSVEKLKSKVTGLIGKRDPDAYEKELNEAKSAADKAVSLKMETIAKKREKMTTLQGTESATKEQRQAEGLALDTKRESLKVWLIDYNTTNRERPLAVEDIAELFAATDRWEEIRATLKKLTEAYTSASTTYSNEIKSREAHQEKKPEQAKDVLAARKKEIEGMSNNELVDKKARLVRHEAAQKQMGSMLEKKKSAELQKCEWEEIAEAIGGDGKTLRKIAQCYTMRFLIEHANVEIRKFNSRYELQQVRNSLGIRVIDHDRADDVRDTTSLSGGETFIVSLGLALGLSALSSRNISFENLFIDEGFGTLDPDTLATVIDSLAMLQSSQGKKVGVISHTDTMFERISTQVRIIKNGNSGSSHIEIYP